MVRHSAVLIARLALVKRSLWHQTTMTNPFIHGLLCKDWGGWGQRLTVIHWMSHPVYRLSQCCFCTHAFLGGCWCGVQRSTVYALIPIAPSTCVFLRHSCSQASNLAPSRPLTKQPSHLPLLGSLCISYLRSLLPHTKATANCTLNSAHWEDVSHHSFSEPFCMAAVHVWLTPTYCVDLTIIRPFILFFSSISWL